MTTTSALRWWPTSKHTSGRLTPMEPPASVELFAWWWMLTLGYFVVIWAVVTLVIWPLLGLIVSPMLRWMTEAVVAVFPNRAVRGRDDSA